MAVKHSSVLLVLLLANSCCWLIASTPAPNNSTQESSPLKSDKSQLKQIPSSAIQSQLEWLQSNKLLSLLKNRSKNSTEPRAPQKRQALGEPASRRDDPWFLDQATNAPQPYRFVYNVKGRNGQTEQYRREVGDGKFLTGSYGYMLPDGIYRHVDYVADDRGFRAFIRTSEPGTANQNPADVVINSDPVPGLQPLRAYENLHPSLRAPLNYTSYSPLLDSYSTLNNPPQQESNRLPPLSPGSIVGGYLPVSYQSPILQSVTEKLSTPSINYIRGADDIVPRLDYDVQDSKWNVKPNSLTGSGFKPLEPASVADWRIRQAQLAPRGPSNTYKLSYDRSPYDLDEAKISPLKLTYDHQLQTNLAAREGPLASTDGASAPLKAINSMGYSSQSFRSEEHRQSNGSRFISKLGEPNQFSSREQASGSKTGSGRDFEYINTPDKDNNSNSEQILLPPPAPQFNQLDEFSPPQPQPQPHHQHHEHQQQQQQQATKGGRSYMEAPYLRFRQETNEARPRDQAAVKGSRTVTDGGSSSGSSSSSNWVTLAPQVGPVRTVRMPEELRASLAMKDLRSMRNNIGLPQPPRMMPSVISEQLDSHFDRMDQAHKVHSRRIDALLSGPNSGAPASALADSGPLSVHQQASVQSSSAVSAPLPSPPTQKVGDSHSAVSTGAPVQEFKSVAAPEPDTFTQLAASNETFEARRLSGGQSQPRAQLLTERVSELEKFQQRLRAQQLLLENVKQQQPAQPNSGSQRNINKLQPASLGSKPRSIAQSLANSQGADNSQVSYDEEPEQVAREGQRSVANKWLELGGAKSNQVAANTPPRQPQPQPAQQRALSDFAKDAKTWPSISISNSNSEDSRLQKNSSSSSSSRSGSGSGTTTNVLPVLSQLPNQLLRSPNQQRASDEAGSGNGATERGQRNFSQSTLGGGGGGGGNTINLDFINSVTALSVDDMNPFAIASVNPGVSMANNRLSSESRLFPHRMLATSGESTRPATMNTRFFISPELRSAADYHEKQNTMGQLRSLFGVATEENELEPTPAGSGHGGSPARPNNHRFSTSAAALQSNGGAPPYMLGAASSASRTTSEGAIGAGGTTSKLVLNSLANQLLQGLQKKPTSEEDVRGASLEMSKHRFYEVASIGSDTRQPDESVSAFVAYKDAQLSIPAMSSRRR